MEASRREEGDEEGDVGDEEGDVGMKREMWG